MTRTRALGYYALGLTVGGVLALGTSLGTSQAAADHNPRHAPAPAHADRYLELVVANEIHHTGDWPVPRSASIKDAVTRVVWSRMPRATHRYCAPNPRYTRFTCEARRGGARGFVATAWVHLYEDGSYRMVATSSAVKP